MWRRDRTSPTRWAGSTTPTWPCALSGSEIGQRQPVGDHSELCPAGVAGYHRPSAAIPYDTMQGSGPADHRFVISPDGRQALYFDASFQDTPFTPQAALINLATGKVAPLPAIAETLSASLGPVVWRPGTDTLAVASGYTANGNPKTWLINVGADTATPIASAGYPMGWAPDNGPLVLSSVYGSSVGQGPYTLSAVTCTSTLQCSSTTLTERAMTFDFLGFMRNP